MAHGGGLRVFSVGSLRLTSPGELLGEIGLIARDAAIDDHCAAPRSAAPTARYGPVRARRLTQRAIIH